MGKSFLVTGTSSGVGHQCALKLAERGHMVFAGVRDLNDWSPQAAGIVPIELDITSEDSIRRAVAKVQKTLGEKGLDGLVNNAGQVFPGPLELLALKDLQQQFAVNLFGPIRLTQEVLPLLRKSTGRLVNVGSIMGRVPWPFSGAYVASKHALAGASDTLALELRSFGIHVSLIEPAAIATPIWQKIFSQSAKFASHPAWNLYQKPMARTEAQVKRAVKRAVAPEIVAEHIVRALLEKNPKERYLVGSSAKVQAFIRWLLPNSLFLAFIRRLAG